MEHSKVVGFTCFGGLKSRLSARKSAKSRLDAQSKGLSRTEQVALAPRNTNPSYNVLVHPAVSVHVMAQNKRLLWWKRCLKKEGYRKYNSWLQSGQSAPELQDLLVNASAKVSRIERQV